jgi:DnaJ like chaperone protein
MREASLRHSELITQNTLLISKTLKNHFILSSYVFFTFVGLKTKETIMAKYGKWIGGGLGWALGGPIGGLLGFMFGSMFDGMQGGNYEYRPPIGDQQGRGYGQRTQTQSGDFVVSLLVLAAAIMKADGRVVKSELEYVKAFLSRQFGEQVASQNVLMLREILKKDYDLREVSGQIGKFMDYASRLELLHFLFGVSMSDGHIDPKEVEVIDQISSYIRVSRADFKSIKAMFIKDNFHNYQILEITPDASDDEVKKAYRKMAVKYHPDKVAHLGPDIQKSANEKFQELNAAYNGIKNERGMN